MCTLPETNIAPENRPLESRRFLLETTIFRGENVSFRECITYMTYICNYDQTLPIYNKTMDQWQKVCASKANRNFETALSLQRLSDLMTNVSMLKEKHLSVMYIYIHNCI